MLASCESSPKLGIETVYEIFQSLVKLQVTCLMLRVDLTHWKQKIFNTQAEKRESAFISTPYVDINKIVEFTGNIMKKFRDTSPLILQRNKYASEATCSG